jgi:hypothetical protein
MPLVNVVIYGLGDAINPCNLSTVILFAALLGWLRRKGISDSSLPLVFIGVAYAAALVYALGGMMGILYSVTFFNTMRVVYFVLGIVLCIAGLLHFIDWIKLRKGNAAALFLPFSAKDVPPAKPAAQVVARCFLVFFAAVLSACSTIWPMNKYISFYTNYLAVPGEVASTVIMLAVYCLTLTVPLVIGLLWMPWTSPSGWVAINPSRAKAVVSAFVLATGINLVYVFH